MLDKILSSVPKDPESYGLSLGEKNISSNNWDFPPSAFASSFLNEWETKRNITPNSSVVDSIRSILEHPNNDFFWKDCKELRKLGDLDDDGILLEFRDRMRGFQDKHLDRQIEVYRKVIEQNIHDIEPIVHRIKKLYDEAKTKKNRGRSLYLRAALLDFTETLDNYKSSLDEGALSSRAAAKLKNETGMLKGVSKIIGLFKDMDISPPYLKAATLDLSLNNPYRHMMWVPYHLYMEIQESWEQDKDKGLCVKIVEKYYDIYNLFSEANDACGDNIRKDVFSESLACAKDGHYTAASLLLYSQTEGLIFDLASRLNKMIFGDLELAIFPDQQNQKKYISIDGKEKELLSVISLLFDSELSKFFWPAFLEYFSSDFYSDRCLLAHGETFTQLSEEEFKTIALFVITLFDIYKNFVNDGVSPVLSECYKSKEKPA